MQTLWFILVAFMLIMYVVLDGFDLGAGAIHLFAARNDMERRTILRAIGPVWDGNEVWLIATGGTLFFTFPILYASSFSGFYLPLIVVLWLLILRGVAIELRSRISSTMWGEFWDVVFFIGSALLTVFLGAAAGNVVRGVPLDKQGNFFEPFWTNPLDPRAALPGILDWYTVLIGLLALVALTAHGANWIAVKSEGNVNVRSRLIARWTWIATVVLTAAGTIATFAIQPAMGKSYTSRPWGFIFPLIAIAGLMGMGYFNWRRQDLRAFLSSAAYLVGMLASSAFGIYPNVLPAVNPANSLTIHNASASQYALTVGLIWWSIGIILALIYFFIVYRRFYGKVSVAEHGEGY